MCNNKNPFLHIPLCRPSELTWEGFRGPKASAMSFILECSHKVDLGNFQCPYEESDLHQLNFALYFQFFSQNYGLQPIFHETQIARISEVFKRKKLGMAAVCEIEKNITRKWENIFELNHDRYFFYKRFRENPEQFLKNRLLDIGRYTNALYFYKTNMEELRKQFQFKVKKYKD